MYDNSLPTMVLDIQKNEMWLDKHKIELNNILKLPNFLIIISPFIELSSWKFTYNFCKFFMHLMKTRIFL